jgi:hypothetical protein
LSILRCALYFSGIDVLSSFAGRFTTCVSACVERYEPAARSRPGTSQVPVVPNFPNFPFPPRFTLHGIPLMSCST